MTSKEKMVYSTVKLECKLPDGRLSVGTGLFYGFTGADKDSLIPFIVTNNHVVKDTINISFRLTLCDENNQNIHQYHQCNIPIEKALIYSHPTGIDLCIIAVSKILSDLYDEGKRPLYTILDQSLLLTPEQVNNLSPIEDILMIGYPNGIYDSLNNLPVIRKGITATPLNNDFEGQKEFLADIPVYTGSSGSPVFLWRENSIFTKDEIILLGIVHAVGSNPIPIDINGTKIKINIPNNLGRVTKSIQLLDFDNVMRDKYLNVNQEKKDSQ